MSSYKCILLVYVKKFSSGHYRIFYRRETVICMGLFDSMKDNMERRQRTREYLKNAKEYINDGEELYQNAYEKVLKRADKTRDAIRKHVEYKKDISRRLGEEILPTIENFQVPDLTTKIDPPFIDGKKAGLTTFSKITVEDIMERLSKHPDLVGVTISGGEPFLQFDELQKLIQRIKQETMLDIMLYSGYTLEHLKQMIPDSMKFFENIDIFVDGEYIQEKNENEMYRGSSNQKIYFFTDRYKAWQEKIMQSKSRNFSFEVKENGEVLFVGIPPKGFYEKFLEKIGGYNDERKKSI